MSNDPKVRASGIHTGHKYGPINLSWKGPNTEFWSGVPGFLMGVPSQEQIDEIRNLKANQILKESKTSTIPSVFDQSFQGNTAQPGDFTHTLGTLEAEENEAAQSLTLGSIPEQSTSNTPDQIQQKSGEQQQIRKPSGDSRLNISSEGSKDLVNVINESLIKRLQNKARGSTLTSTGSVGGKGSMANNSQRLLDIYKARLEQGAGVNQASKAASKAVEEVVPQIPSLEGLEVPEGAFDPDQLEKFFGTGAEKAADVAEKGMNLSFGPLGMGSFNTATGALGLANPWMIGLNFLKKIAETNQAKANLPKNVPSTRKPGLTKQQFPYYVGR